jgi:hypothetical protein
MAGLSYQVQYKSLTIPKNQQVIKKVRHLFPNQISELGEIC